jgi:hypothetical protein
MTEKRKKIHLNLFEEESDIDNLMRGNFLPPLL